MLGECRMKSRIVLVVAIILIILLSACGKGAEETVAKSEYEEVVSKLSEAEDNQKQMQAELENIKKELEALKTAIHEEENQEIEAQTESLMEVKEEEGLTVATDPIVVPDSCKQSEFVVEVTAENFLSIFEYIALNKYDTWGEYAGKSIGFSSLLYEQGWALGKVEDFAVEYCVYDDVRRTVSNPLTSIVFTSDFKEFGEMRLRIYRAKGTLTFYPIEFVSDTNIILGSYQYITRELPDGSVVEITVDLEGNMCF